MGNNDLAFDNERFSAVWQRVNPACECGRPPEHGCAPSNTDTSDIARLRQFIDEEAAAARYCCKMSQKCGGRLNRPLSSIASGHQRHLKGLRAEYFILTGEAYCQPDTCPVICSVSEALRNIYLDETRMAEQYCKAADTAARGDLKCLYRKYARDEECYANAVYNLVENMLC